MRCLGDGFGVVLGWFGDCGMVWEWFGGGWGVVGGGLGLFWNWCRGGLGEWWGGNGTVKSG